ncbi:MBOAT family O-acyltransferase [Desulforhopalus singaporensis]|uniref:Alginate O-acetyltransferase complex protein AlgI n=1 Tax=Desulforhopalus singaporensis TaxID=91360 RepID=A0A1H0SZR9_9BACT|nr:MBOAT family protein [Desulforhopalus singaporensis]SDP47214.1 alginate O-acetyltransferase complex protein AlgI [Desulforhopalus singaporensis]
MVFSSHIFLYYFLPLSLLFYYGMPRRWKNIVLTFLSYIFYGWSNPLFILLMLFSTLVDYCCGLVIGESRSEHRRLRKGALVLSIVTNLGLLGFFKYTGFALESYNQLFGIIGGENFNAVPVLTFLLPLGISFYTFQSMSYTIDVYRNDARHITNFLDFACFVSMFPQLVAGPIIRFQEVAQQLATRVHSVEKFSRGVAFFSLGMAKKVLLANSCGRIADITFGAGSLNWLDAWFGICAYAFQIYFDFSGYSDMAIGLGLMFGFVFAKNFDSPYISESITDFWRRWHISLSTWLREYLYIPLGGNRHGSVRTAVNLAIVMLLGGLWHGASWNFVIWGAIHGTLLGGERLFGRKPVYHALPRALRIGLTFVLVLVAWVFFRAETLGDALGYLASMFGVASVPASSLLLDGMLYTPYHLMAMSLGALVVWGCPQTWDWTRELSYRKIPLIVIVFVVSAAVLSMQSYNPFIYFNF